MSTRPLRVLHILQYMYGYGAERQIAKLLSRIQSADVEVGVLTVYAQSSEGREAFDFPVTSAGRRVRRDYGFIPNLIRGVQAFHPDIVHTHTLSGKYWGRMAAVACGVRNIVHTEHNPCDHQQSLAQNVASRILNRQTSRIITFFPEQGAFLSRREGVERQKLAIIPNGLDFEKPPAAANRSRELLGVKDDEYLVMTVGRLTYQKHPQLAIQTVAALPLRDRSRVVLCFAGTGDLEPELRALAQSLNVADRIRFLGYRADVSSLLAGSDLLLMTSRYEGMPLTLIEAMRAGTPILTTPWLGSSTMLGGGKYGRVADGDDPEELASWIVATRTHRAATTRMTALARAYAESAYALDRMVQAHRRLYEELVETSAVAA